MSVAWRLFYLVGVSLVVSGLLYGAELGAFGWTHAFISMEAKTTAILSLSIFGFYCVCMLAWLVIAGKNVASYEQSSLLAAVIIGMAYSVYFAFYFQDCSIFNFCSNPAPYCPSDDCR